MYFQRLHKLPHHASSFEQRIFSGQGLGWGDTRPCTFSFYRRFISDFAKVSKPLTSLLCKDKDFIIEDEGKQVFMQLKQSLVEAPF